MGNSTMKKFILAALAFLLASGPVLAQWQVPNNAVPIGRGSSAQGFKSAVPPASASAALFGTGAATPPAFRQPSFTDLLGNIAVGQMNSGTGATAGTWWRGDGTWNALPAPAGFYATKTAAQSAIVPASVDVLTTYGYSSVGDNGGGQYIRVGGGPSTVYRFQSADGQWWALNNRAITPEQFGCAGNGVANDTACWNELGTYLTATAINPPVLNNRVGAVYKIWPFGAVPSTLMTLDGLVGWTWNFNGSCFTTDQNFAGAFGVAIITHSQDITVNAPCYRETAWGGTLSPLLGAIFFAVQETTAPWTQRVTINNGYMDGGVGFLRVNGGLTTPAASTGGEAKGFIVDNAEIVNVMYPLLFQASGDDFVARNVKLNNSGRGYFAWNVSNHKVDIDGNGGSPGGLQQIDVTTYAYPNMSVTRRMTSNIDVNYRMTPVAGYGSGEIGSQVLFQVVPRATISAAANNGSGLTRLTVNSTANMLDGQTWFCTGATGTTAINGYQVIDVINATQVDVPVTFVATSPGGYCTVPATQNNIKIKFDVENPLTGTAGNILFSQYKFDEVPAADTFVRGYQITNVEVSGRQVGFNNAVTPTLRIFSPALGTWDGETINNVAVRNFYLSGAAGTNVSVTSPTTAVNINLENIVSSGPTWALGGTALGFNVTNVSATGITDRNAVVPSNAPVNQFATGIGATGIIAYTQPAFTDLSGSIATTQIPTTGVPARIGAVARVVRQSFCPSGCSTTVAAGSTATYTPTTGILYAIVETVGSGGGGGGAVGVLNQQFIGGGGGSGGYSRSILTAATIGASKVVSIGLGGAGGAAGANNGGSGGQVCLTTTTCVSGQIVVANGGGGGGFSQSAVAGGNPGAAALVGTGDLTITGTPGQAGLYYPVAGTISIPAGAGGSSFYGGGAPSAGTLAGGGANGTAGSAYGGGGSGGTTQIVATNRAGGDGAAGIVFITEFVNQ
jgi:hypothetical protein